MLFGRGRWSLWWGWGSGVRGSINCLQPPPGGVVRAVGGSGPMCKDLCICLITSSMYVHVRA